MIYFDLETVPQDDIKDNLAWSQKMQNASKRGVDLEYSDAGLDGCFGKICAAAATTYVDGSWMSFSSAGTDELEIITGLLEYINEATVALMKRTSLCAFNGLGFDFPFLALRCLGNDVQLPVYLRTHGKKKWDLDHLVDPMEALKFTNWRGAASVSAVSHLLSIPTPKDDINGSQVWDCYLKGEHERIKTYCEKDVKNLAAIVKKLIKLGVM